MAKTDSVLLKVVSILYIIFGGVTVLAVLGLAGGLGSLLGAAAGAVGVGIAAVGLSSLSTLLSGVIELAAGIVGLSGRSALGRVFAWVILILAATGFIAGFVRGGFNWLSLVGVVLPVLYFIGARG